MEKKRNIRINMLFPLAVRSVIRSFPKLVTIENQFIEIECTYISFVHTQIVHTLFQVSRLQLPNTFGRAENVSVEYNKSLKGDHGGLLRFSKPLNGNPDVRQGIPQLRHTKISHIQYQQKCVTVSSTIFQNNINRYMYYFLSIKYGFTLAQFSICGKFMKK